MLCSHSNCYWLGPYLYAFKKHLDLHGPFRVTSRKIIFYSFKFHWHKRTEQRCRDCKQKSLCQAERVCAFCLNPNPAVTHWSPNQRKKPRLCSSTFISVNWGVTTKFCQAEPNNGKELQNLKLQAIFLLLPYTFYSSSILPKVFLPILAPDCIIQEFLKVGCIYSWI